MDVSPFSVTLEADDQCGTHRLALYLSCVQQQEVIIIIIIIISIFKEDNVFSITASLPYGPPVNTDIDYYRTLLFGLVYLCKCCEVSCAICVWRREANACLVMLSTKQGSHWYHF